MDHRVHLRPDIWNLHNADHDDAYDCSIVQDLVDGEDAAVEQKDRQLDGKDDAGVGDGGRGELADVIWIYDGDGGNVVEVFAKAVVEAREDAGRVDD